MTLLGDLGGCFPGCDEEMQVTRFVPTKVVKGRRQAQVQEQCFNIWGSFQTGGSAELEIENKGLTSSGMGRLFTTTKLLTNDTSECKEADRVLRAGVLYQVQDERDWSELGNYYRYTLVRVNR